MDTMDTMNAGVLYGIRDIRYEKVRRPVPGPGEVLVRIRASSICNSDIERYLGRMIYRYPLIPGHEMAGEIAGLGPGARSRRIGQIVAVYPLLPCGTCNFCQGGRHNLCDQYGYLGSRSDGGFAEYVRCPEENTVLVPPGVSVEEAAAVEPMAVSHHAAQLSGIRPDSSVVVYGLGPIGLFSVQWAKVMGAKTIIGVDRHAGRLEAARRYGATQSVDSGQSLDTINRATGGQGADVILECSGSAALQNEAIHSVRKTGTITLVGNAKKDLTIPDKDMARILRREIRIQGSWNSLREPDWKACMAALDKGKVEGRRMISHRIPLERIGETFENIVDKKVKGTRWVFTMEEKA